MYEEVIVKMPNNMEVILWRTGDEICLGLVNVDGYVLSDRKLTEEEVENLKLVADKP